MTGEDSPEPRISDADRERAVRHLNDGLSEGRLTIAEFEERVSGVLAARTASELRPLVVDLPGGGALTAGPPEHGEIRSAMSRLTRSGPWLVPRRLTVHSKAGNVKLNFTEARIAYPVVEVTLDSYAGTTILVLPEDASVDVTELESNMVAANVRVRRIPATGDPVGRPHVVVRGRQWAGTLIVRPPHRFLRWRW